MYEQTISNDVTQAGGGNTLLAGRYHVVRQLGTGGMGSVWLAEDTQLDNKLFAVKILPSILVSNKRAYRQLKDEALVAMKLVHPNIVQIRAFEENDGNPFLVMDYIEGQTLDDYLANYNSRVEGGLPEADVIRILRPIAAALDYAHSKGVVHRDVKPGNVMIAKDGTPYILDFGIAREIQETMTRVTGKLSSGTLLYMSPEQLRGQPPKAAQDVYSFAAMAYECLKGEPPFSRGQVEYQILNEQPERLSHDIRMSASIMRGLSKTPEARPDTCVKVLLAACPIRQMSSARLQVAVPPRPATPMVDRIAVRQKRNIAGIAIPLSCLIASLLVLGGVLWHREVQRQENARKLAVKQRQEEARRRQAEDERKAQEAAALKKAEAERKAKEDAERRKKVEEDRLAAERRARDSATEKRIEAKVQQGKVARISDADGFKARKDRLEDVFIRAEAFYDDRAKRWADAEALYREYIEQSKGVLSLADERQAAMAEKNAAHASFKKAEDEGAKTYASSNWNEAVKVWQKGAGELSHMEFAAARSSFGEASRLFSESGRIAKAERSRQEQQAAERERERLREQRRRQAEELERAAERQRKFAQYSAVKVGALVQIATEANALGHLGVVVANENGIIEISMGVGENATILRYPYAGITSLIVRGDVDENAIMRKTLVGSWMGTTKYGTSGANIDMRYEYTFNADGTVQMKDVTIFQSSRATASSGTWTVAGDGKVLSIHVTSGPDAGKTRVYNLIKRSGDTIEFRWDLDHLRRDDSHKGFSNVRYWYDASGVYHFEGDCKSGWSTYRVVNTETPRIMRRVR